jgi:hypothetical protein
LIHFFHRFRQMSDIVAFVANHWLTPAPGKPRKLFSHISGADI